MAALPTAACRTSRCMQPWDNLCAQDIDPANAPPTKSNAYSMPESAEVSNRTVQKVQLGDRIALMDFRPAGIYTVVGVLSSGRTFFLDLQSETSEQRRRLVLQRGFRLRVVGADVLISEIMPVPASTDAGCFDLPPGITRPHPGLFPT